jgi:hypothetical protein
MPVRLFLHLNGNIYIIVDSTEIMMMLFFEEWVELINSGFCLLWFFEPVLCGARLLTSESVQSLSLALEGVDDIHGGHGLTASVLGV